MASGDPARIFNGHASHNRILIFLKSISAHPRHHGADILAQLRRFSTPSDFATDPNGGIQMIVGYTPTFPMEQDKVLGNDRMFDALYHSPKSDHKRQGVCTGLSMAWINHVLKPANHSETPVQREKAFKGGAEVVLYRLAGQAQDHARAGLARVADKPVTSPTAYISERFGASLRLYGLRNVPRTEMMITIGVAATIAGAEANALVASASKNTYRLYGVAFRGSEGLGGHCCASYASSGKIFGLGRHLYFFDCNFGEYKVDLSEANKFLTAWLQVYGKIGLAQMLSFNVEKGL